MPDPRRLTALVEQWVESVLTAASVPEDIVWESVLMPGPDGQPALVIFVWMPSPVMGQKLVGSVLLNPAGLDEAQTGEAVLTLVEQLRDARTKQLAPLNGHGGGPAGPSGLIVPGR